MSDFQQTITSLNLLHTSLYRMELFQNAHAVKNVKTDVISLISRLEAVERERDELRAEQAEHDEQISRMEGKFSLAKRALDSKTARCEKAEAELRRRDAAAGVPVAWQYRYNDGKVGDWKTVDSESECNHSPCYERRAIYTDGKPAVLPPAISTDGLDPESRDIDDVRNLAHIVGANWMRQQCLELCAQQQKVVELYKRKSMEVISGQRYSYVLLEDLLPELDAAGVKWEVKK